MDTISTEAPGTGSVVTASLTVPERLPLGRRSSVTLSGTVRVNLVAGARLLAGNATLSGSYVVDNEALADGDFSLSLADVDLTIGDVLTITLASATVSQPASDLVIDASAATASLAVPGGPALTLSANSLDLVLYDAGGAALLITGGAVALSGVPDVTLTVNGVSAGQATTVTPGVYTWPVTLVAGTNTVEVTGNRDGQTYTDTVSWDVT